MTASRLYRSNWWLSRLHTPSKHYFRSSLWRESQISRSWLWVLVGCKQRALDKASTSFAVLIFNSPEPATAMFAGVSSLAVKRIRIMTVRVSVSLRGLVLCPPGPDEGSLIILNLKHIETRVSVYRRGRVRSATNVPRSGGEWVLGRGGGGLRWPAP